MATAALAGALAVSGARGPAVRAGLVHPDAEALRDAGWRHGLPRWELVRSMLIAAAVLAVMAVGAPLVLAIPLAGVPSMWIRARAERARERARRAHARILAGVASALRSGLALPEALRRATSSSEDELATRSLRAALRAFDLGSGLDGALLSAAGSARDDGERIAAGTLALGVAERLPRDRLAELVEAVADRAAFGLRLEDEVRARSAGARQQQKLLAVIVPGLALYLSITMPSLAATLGSDLGRYVLIPGAAALELGGIVLGRRIVRGVPR